ncbi:hypothetical protein AV530_006598 [Patagioenas fasciata monilis]|uniref:Uncharacterized protein n=1 Tax=Patagioenas fasciata monilis TaxID=372326 RepID=A0A1V4KIV0_PATFA|nr:hypothetical protein AV530_006598 [Patagioenas fasciata monilis]
MQHGSFSSITFVIKISGSYSDLKLVSKLQSKGSENLENVISSGTMTEFSDERAAGSSRSFDSNAACRR